ncbi:MAG: hypothetical protein ACYDEB_00200 [Dehalococcoidia bacterium]
MAVEAEVGEERDGGVQQLRRAGAEAGHAEVEDAQALDGAGEGAELVDGAGTCRLRQVGDRALAEGEGAVH